MTSARVPSCATGSSQFGGNTDYLEVHPDEFAELFNVIRIDVTSFFRDEPAWEHIRDKVIRR
jgi:two-component system CheB/CheR fusion protein